MTFENGDPQVQKKEEIKASNEAVTGLTCQVDENVAAVIRKQTFGSRGAGGETPSQDSKKILHCDLQNKKKCC